MEYFATNTVVGVMMLLILLKIKMIAMVIALSARKVKKYKFRGGQQS